MAWLRGFIAKNYWRYSFSLQNAVKSMLAVFAVLWLVTEIVAFFSSAVGAAIQAHWPSFLLVGFGWTLWECRPRLSMKERVRGKDAFVEICVGDCFESDGVCIIGSNTDFRTSGIDPASVQAQFAHRFCGSPAGLDGLLTASLADERPGLETSDDDSGGRRVYPIGTVARVEAGGKEAYFVAIAELNEYGKAASSAAHIELALSKLWRYVARRGGIGPLVVPVLGSGLSRIDRTRGDLIRTIILSFVAACAAGKFAERLTIVIHPRDFQTHDIDLEELRFFLKYACAYGEPRGPALTGHER
ncbi:macro domain-containing protein [Paenibacillus sp. GYB003]|uniref:macro domain-containing protein n=1 Tax=Paenibacillus sp. GYB003 TaxID=2994392 RepID=UPI002F96E33F